MLPSVAPHLVSLAISNRQHHNSLSKPPRRHYRRCKMTGLRPNHRSYDSDYRCRIQSNHRARDCHANSVTLQSYQNDYTNRVAQAVENYSARKHRSRREMAKVYRTPHTFREMTTLMLLCMRPRTVPGQYKRF